MGGQPRAVAFLLPGQGAQHPGMATDLYGSDPVFTATMDEFFAAGGDDGDRLRRVWIGAETGAELADATVAQPLLYALDVALGTMVRSWGVEPVALIGHSVGELAAATLAGVFDISAGANLMRRRGEAVAATGPGGMLAVAASPDQVTALLAAGSVIGAVNAPRHLAIAGPPAALAETERALRGAGLVCLPIAARQAFHSPVVAAAAVAFERAFAGVTLAAPSIPIHSTRTGALVTAVQSRSPEFWAAQLTLPVRFDLALSDLLDARDVLLLETGPGQGLTTTARRHPAIRAGRSAAVALLSPIEAAVDALNEAGHPCAPPARAVRG